MLSNSEVSFADSIDRLKESFLWAAAQGGNTQDCEALLNIGADVNWKNAEGDTPLLAACRRGHHDTIRLLLSNGADVNIPGRENQTALHISASRGDESIAELLILHNASQSAKNAQRQTPADLARAKGHQNVVTRLNQGPRASNSIRSNPQQEISNRVSELPAVNLPPQRDNISNSASASSSGVRGSSAKKSTSLDKILLRVAKQGEEAIVNPGVSESLAKTSSSFTNINATATSGTSSNYSLISQMTPSEIINSMDEQTVSLMRLLEAEKASKKTIEAKLEVFARQNKQLIEEFNGVNRRMAQQETNVEAMTRQLKLYRADSQAMESLTLEECDNLEKEMKKALLVVEQKKAALIRNQIETQKEHRLCIVCQEKEKSVVLLPCRHMCLCDVCSTHDALDQCPLCREAIAHKISVFA